MNAHLILTVDYEIFGNGLGCVDRCVIDPAERMMSVAHCFAAPLTFFAETLEFMAMEQVDETAVHAAVVVSQLKKSVSRGHDVQLHLHPQFEGAQWNDSKWKTTDGWRIGDLDGQRCQNLIVKGKQWLEKHLLNVSPAYRCLAFRAGGWCIQPSDEVVRVLIEEGFEIDSTVAPGMVNRSRGEWSNFRGCPNLPLWKVDGDVCNESMSGLLEIPITVGRIARIRHYKAVQQARSSGEGGMATGCEGNYSGVGNGFDVLCGKLGKISRLGNVMLDFSTMPADVLIDVSEQWMERHARSSRPVPLVAIAHTKNFTEASERHLFSYLEWAKEKGIRFSTYGQWLEAAGE